MFVVELERFYTKIFSAGFFYSMVAVFAAGILPGFFLVPAIITVVAFIGWSVVCAYRTERFVTYASFRLFTNLFLGPMLAFALALSVSYKLLKLDPVLVFVLSGAPFAIVGLAYVVVCLCSIDRPVLKVVGGRVDVLESPPSHSPWLAGLSAGVGSLVYSMIREYDDFYLGVIVLTIAISLYTVFIIATVFPHSGRLGGRKKVRGANILLWRSRRYGKSAQRLCLEGSSRKNTTHNAGHAIGQFRAFET
ncbi:hypothetical protein AAH995_28080 [Pseudomonas putida]|uniref:hypothetical protein n=1 Tax=Pseudomonas putida TaxID=303 RepID=UPI00349EE4C3